MAKLKEKTVIINTTFGAMDAQITAERKYCHLDGFAVVYVSPVVPNQYKVCFQYYQQTSTPKS